MAYSGPASTFRACGSLTPVLAARLYQEYIGNRGTNKISNVIILIEVFGEGNSERDISLFKWWVRCYDLCAWKLEPSHWVCNLYCVTLGENVW